VIRDEELQQNALEVGDYLTQGLLELRNRHALIGDVRGPGLFIGVEFVRDRETLEPADSEASQIVERMKERCVLLSTDGPYHNVIKIKPPMVFSKADADLLISGLDCVLKDNFSDL
jgi:4-aminobutyrate aminotransferase-like enzyme